MGTSRTTPATSPTNRSLGDPVVLYPDPEKDPTGHDLVSDLWAELRQALEWSDHVLVLGHSLHDPALIRILREFVGKTKIAVTYADERDHDYAASAISNKVTTVQVIFGPGQDVGEGGLRSWIAA